MRANPRLCAALAVLALGACDVQNDRANDEVTVKYDEERIKQTASDTARTAGAVAKGAANVASDTARSVKREVGDVDVDVKVTRDRSGERVPTE